jgi:heme exporter protein C
VLLLIYAAYFALRSAVEGTESRAALSAVYAVLALPAMAFLMFILPRVMFSLHPADTLSSGSGLSNQYRVVLYPAILGFIALFIWIFRIKTALAEIKLKMRRY